jgi:hypothetical protein
VDATDLRLEWRTVDETACLWFGSSEKCAGNKNSPKAFAFGEFLPQEVLCVCWLNCSSIKKVFIKSAKTSVVFPSIGTVLLRIGGRTRFAVGLKSLLHWMQLLSLYATRCFQDLWSGRGQLVTGR